MKFVYENEPFKSINCFMNGDLWAEMAWEYFVCKKCLNEKKMKNEINKLKTIIALCPHLTTNLVKSTYDYL